MIILSSNIVSENAIAGQVVGALSVSSLTGSITYELLADSSGGGFAIVGNLLVVANGSLVDFESLQQVELSISASNGVDSAITSTVTVDVTDLFEITGGAGDDFLTGTGADDVLSGGDGNDILDGSYGNDVLVGGAGADDLYDNRGLNTFDGGEGDDWIGGRVGTGPVLGGDGHDNIDVFVAQQGATVDGGAGDDVISVVGEAANVTGGDGNDDISANGLTVENLPDDTQVVTGSTVDAGAGNDRVWAGDYATVTLGTGQDTYVATSFNAAPVITDFTAAEDKIDLNNLLQQIADGGFYLTHPAWDQASNPFAGGFLQLSQDGADAVLSVLRERETMQDVYDEFGNFIDSQFVYVTSFDPAVRLQNVDAATLTGANFTPAFNPDGSPTPGQVIDGTVDNDDLVGGVGDDTISGGDGNDTLNGSYGNDVLVGGAGADDLYDNRGLNTFDGGEGDDWIGGRVGTGPVLGGDGHDNIDVFVAQQGATVDGGAGDDVISVVGEAANVTGGDGNDDISANGLTVENLPDDTQVVTGSTVDAGAGNDRVWAGDYATVTLGTGQDTYVATSFNAAPVITDFTAAEDKIDLNNLLQQIADGGFYFTHPTWDQASNPFAVGFLQLSQDGADAVLSILRERETMQDVYDELGNIIDSQFVYVTSFDPAVRLQNVDATTLTVNNFTPGYSPDGSNEQPNLSPVANPDFAPYTGTDSIQYLAFSAKSGAEMWRLGSDGSLVQISNSNLSPIDQAPEPIQLGNQMYFNLVAPNGNHQIFFNTSNQGRGGITTALNEAAGGIIVTEWIAFGGALYFHANPAGQEAGAPFGAGIFKVDAAAPGGAVRLTDESAGDPPGFYGPIAVGNTLIWAANDPAHPTDPAFEIFALRAGDATPTQITNSNVAASQYPNADTVVLGDSAYFIAVDATTGSHQLYQLTIDGGAALSTASTTFQQVTHLNETADHGMVVDKMVVAEGKIYLKTPHYIAADDPANATGENGGLFVYDPATNATTRITDDGNSNGLQGFELPVVIGDTLYFGAIDGATGQVGTYHIGPDGSTGFDPNADIGATSVQTIVFGQKQYWNGNSLLDGSGDGQIYVYNPADGSDVALTSLHPGAGGIRVDGFFEMGGALYFHAVARLPESSFAAGIFKLDPAAPGGAIRITDESQPGTPQGFISFGFDTGAVAPYGKTDIVTIDVLANDTDADPGASADNFTLVSATIAGVDAPDGAVIGSFPEAAVSIVNNQLRFDPGSAFANLTDEVVTVTINYTMMDANGAQSSSYAVVAFNGPLNLSTLNGMPVALLDLATTETGQSVVIDVLANDSDPDGDLLTVASATAAHGSIIVGPDNRLSYTPEVGFTGLDTIAYTISDGRGGTATGTAEVNVQQGNLDPNAQADSAATHPGQTVVVDALANDSDPEGAALFIGNASAANGIVSITPDQKLSYTPNAGFLGVDIITYSILDGQGGSATAQVSVTVSEANLISGTIGDDELFGGSGDDLIVGNGGSDYLGGGEGDDTLVGGANFDVLEGGGGNDRLIGGGFVNVIDGGTGIDTAVFAKVRDGYNVYRDLVSGEIIVFEKMPASEGAELTQDRTVGIESFEFSDGMFDFATLGAIDNTPATTTNDTATVAAGGTITINVLSNDSDVDGDTLNIYNVVPLDSGAAVTWNETGDITFVAASDFSGSFSYEYSVWDGRTGVSTAIATFTAEGVFEQISLTTAADNVLPSNNATTVNANAETLNSGDSLVSGDGVDTLRLFGGGTFNLNTVVAYSGFEKIEVVNITSTPVSVTLRENTTQDVTVSTSAQVTLAAGNGVLIGTYQGGAGRDVITLSGTASAGTINTGSGYNDTVTVSGSATVSQIVFAQSGYSEANANVYDDASVGVIDLGPSQWSRVNLFGNAQVSSILGVGEGQVVQVHSVGGWNPALSINLTGPSSGLYFYASGMFDLTSASISSVEHLHFSNGAVGQIDSDALADVTNISGNQPSRIETANAELNLTGISVSGVTVHSTNATGTTFTVDSKQTAFQIVGGPGADTLVLVGVTLTENERDAIINTTLIENIIELEANTAPAVTSDFVTTSETTSITIDVLANDTDIDIPTGDSISLISASVANVTGPDGVVLGTGQVSIIDNQVVFVPGNDFAGLSNGKSATVTVNYTVGDTRGGATTGTATITVTGEGVNNTAPTASDVTITIQQGQIPTGAISGAHVQDADGDTLTITYGTSVLGAVMAPQGDGPGIVNAFFSYGNLGSEAFVYLGQNNVLMDSLTYTVSDGHGGTAQGTITLIFEGINDLPVANPDTATTNEESEITVNVVANDTDADQGAILVVNTASIISVTGPEGVTLGTGSVSAQNFSVIFNPGSDFLSLDENQTATVTIEYMISDGSFSFATSTLTLTITGVGEPNTAPTVTDVSGTIIEDDASVLIALAGTDGDGDPLSYEIVTPPSVGTAQIIGGNLEFLTAGAFNGLAADEEQLVEISYRAVDSHGAVSDTATVTVTVTGTNDAPTAANMSDITVTVGEEPAEITLAADDVDSDDDSTTLEYLIDAAPGFGTVAIDPITKKLVFDTGNDFDHLNAGQQQVVSITYRAVDAHGAQSAPASIFITVVGGANQAPVILPESTLDGVVTEDVEPSASGVILAADQNTSNILTFTGSASGLYGLFSLNAATGAWTYTLDPAAADALVDGQIEEEQFLVTVADGLGGEASETVAITVFGTNDGPAAAADDIRPIIGANTAANAALVIDHAQLLSNDSDPDGDDIAIVSVDTLSSNGATLTLDGTTIVYSPLNVTAFQALAAGEIATDTFQYVITDGNFTAGPVIVTLSVIGTNDEVVVTSADVTGAVVEDGVASASGTILFSDADLGDAHTATAVPSAANTTALGTFAVGAVSETADTASGSAGWTYTLSQAAAQYLAAGESVTEVYDVTIDDGQGSSVTRSVTITIEGTNDIAELTAVKVSGSVTQGPAVLTETGSLTFTDADLSDTHTVVATPAVSSHGTFYGSLTATVSTDTAGSGTSGVVTWQYTVDGEAIKSLAANQTVTEQFSILVSDGKGGNVSQPVTIAITGTNDAPTLAQVLPVTVDENQNLALPALFGSDVDAGDMLTYHIAGGPDAGAFAIDPATGQLTFVALPDFEQPGDTDGDNIYVVDVNVTDAAGASSEVRTVAISIQNVTGVTLSGTNVADTYVGTTEADILSGQGANDILTGLGGADLLSGGNGSDTLAGGDGSDTLDGGAGVDSVSGGDGNDVIIIRGNDAQSDIISGGAGVDTLAIDLVSAESVVLSSFDAGASSIEAWTGNGGGLVGTGSANTFNLSALTSITGLTLIDGVGGNDIIVGSIFADVIRGGLGLDSLEGGEGNDTLAGGTGLDTVRGGAGDDVIEITGAEAASDITDAGGEVLGDRIQVTGSGEVVLTGFSRVSTGVEIWSGNGAGLLGTSASNTFDFTDVAVTALAFIDAGGGDDTITGSSLADDLRGGAGADLISGASGADRITGGTGADTLNGGSGDDTFVVSDDEALSDVISGGDDGIAGDAIEVSGTADLILGTFSALNSGIERWLGNDRALLGTSAANTFDLQALTAISGLTHVDGGSGNDQITGSTFADDLRGGRGNDTLTGGDGADRITGGAGTDQMLGGAGDDTFVVTSTEALTDTLDGGIGVDTIEVTGSINMLSFNSVSSSIEVWLGTGGSLTGSSAANTLDLSNLTSVSGLTFVDGSGGNDILLGSSVADELRGGSGADRLTGAGGNDTLTGGGGNDVFIFTTGAGSDRVTDFATGDKLDLTAFAVHSLADLQTLGTVTLQAGGWLLSIGDVEVLLANKTTALSNNDFVA